jgi:hypothetical protein
MKNNLGGGQAPRPTAQLLPSAGFAGAIDFPGGGREERAVRRVTTDCSAR